MPDKKVKQARVDNSLDKITDMPKIPCPFVREKNEKGEYVVKPEVREELEWFREDGTKAIEKIDGTNVSLVIKNGVVEEIYNRTKKIDIINKGKSFITKGVLNSNKRGYLDELNNGQFFGELVGPKLQGNPYELEEHIWIPFQRYSEKHLTYKSWGKYPQTFEAISEWFKDGLIPLFYCNFHGVDIETAEERNAYVEGVIFKHPDGRLAKLRRDMFEWYKGERH